MVSQLDLFGLTVDAREARAPRSPGIQPVPASDTLRNLAARLPGAVRLGTSSWSFPGWRGLVYADAASESALSRRGLAAYAAHPLLRTVSLDRTFYSPLSAAEYARHAEQVPDDFRFVVKAAAEVTSAWQMGETSGPRQPNPRFLDAELTLAESLMPALQGLHERLGVLVFQFTPMGGSVARRGAARLAERLDQFLDRLRKAAPQAPLAVEVRDAPLLTPLLGEVLTRHRVSHCLSVHPRMPSPAAQAAALSLAGPLMVRWNLHSAMLYDEAKARYAPFDRLVDEDPQARQQLADLAVTALQLRQPVYIVANNKAEGSAPWTILRLAEAIVARLSDGTGPTPA